MAARKKSTTRKTTRKSARKTTTRKTTRKRTSEPEVRGFAKSPAAPREPGDSSLIGRR